MFAVRHDNIIIGAKKIYVNLPRFQRTRNSEEEEQLHATPANEEANHWTKSRWQVTTVRKRGMSLITKGGRSTHMLIWPGNWRRSMHRQVGGQSKLNPQRRENKGGLCYEVSEEEMERLNKMYVGEVKNPGSTHIIQEWFNMQGFFSIKVTPMGANLVLMEEMEEGIIPALI